MVDKARLVLEGYEAYTYTEVQGAEWPVVCVRITAATLMTCSNEMIFTAITRCTKGLWIQSDLPTPDLSRLAQHPIFGPLLDQRSPTHPMTIFGAKFSDVALALPSSVHDVYGAKITQPADVLCAWSNARLDNLPASFRANAPIIWEQFSREPNCREPSPSEEPVRTHLPMACDPNSWLELEPVKNREARELYIKGESSQQFLEYSKRGGYPVEANFFPKQSAKHDPTLFKSAIHTRFDYATPEHNLDEYHKQSWLGPLLFERFRRYLGLPDTL